MEYKTLGSLVDRKIGYGIVQPGRNILHGVPVIKVNNLIAGLHSKGELDVTTKENDEKYSRTRLEGGELIVSVVGTVGKTAIVPKSFRGCNLVRAVAMIDIKENWLSEWVKYYIDSPAGQAYIEQNLNTTVQATLNIKTLVDMPIPFLKEDEMRKIVTILEAIDRKIECNQQINDNLLAQAQTIKKQWVATNEAGYEMLPLAEVATINPDTYSPKEAWEFVNYLDTSSITDGFVADIQHIVPSSEKLPSRARRKVAAGDVLFSTVRPNQNHFGIISDPLPNMLASTGFADIRSKTPLVCNELIYLCLTEGDFIEKMQQLAEQSTSTFPSIKPSDLGACQIPCPKDESSNVFNDTLKTLFSLIAANFRENNSLGAMRDALLPKLMSGEIEVSAVKL